MLDTLLLRQATSLACQIDSVKIMSVLGSSHGPSSIHAKSRLVVPSQRARVHSLGRLLGLQSSSAMR